MRRLAWLFAACLACAPAAAQQLPRWQAALANVQSGRAPAYVALIGDSKTFGYGSQGAVLGSMRANGYPSQLAKFFALSTPPVPASASNFFGVGNPTSYPKSTPIGALDSRMSSSSSAWCGCGVVSLGGSGFFGDGAGKLSFTPADIVDSVDVYSLVGEGGSSYANIDGGPALAQISAAGPYGVKKTSVRFWPGHHTIGITPISGASTILAEDAYLSTMPAVHLLNMGMNGAKAGDIDKSASPWDPLQFLRQIRPSLVIYAIGANDWNLGTPVSTFAAQVQDAVNNIRQYADVVLITEMGTAPSFTPLSVQQPYINAVRSIAAASGATLIDYNSFGSWNLMSQIGNTHDVVHENQHGYALLAGVVYSVIANAPGP